MMNLFSVDNPKAAKAAQYGYLNAIHYMAPASLSGHNMCAMSTPQCREPCIGWESGKAAMVSHRGEINSVRAARIRKARHYMERRDEYMGLLIANIAKLHIKAQRLSMRLCVRLNGSTDIPFERVPVHDGSGWKANIMECFPYVQFDDYTKIHNRFNRELPANYHLVYSRAEGRSEIALQLLARGISVAIVSRRHRPKYGQYLEQWCGFKAVNGDQHDLIHLWDKGSVIALSPKGLVAKRIAKLEDDGEGFIL